MIISASRRTDIPAFYSDWFINRLNDGYVIVRNPMNHQPLKILLAPDIVDCIVFWTKNPIPMIPKLAELKDYCYYFQFTLTCYGNDIEKNLPDKKKNLIPAFKKLSEIIGPERVIWRYDPILINSRYTREYHLNAFTRIASELNGYTQKCVFSFVDVFVKNIKALNEIGAVELSEKEMREMAVNLRDIAVANNIELATCAETIDLSELGIRHNACIDMTLIEKLTGGTVKAAKKYMKDSGQREACGCMLSKEIGTHNTCGNGCLYCYANYNPDSVKKCMAKYDPDSPILCDTIEEGEVVKDASDMNSWVDKNIQMSLFNYI